MGDPTRRAVLVRLRGGPLSVGDIAKGMSVTRPAVSQHLKVLKQAGLVIDRAQGTRRFYRINRRGLRAMRAWVDALWRDCIRTSA